MKVTVKISNKNKYFYEGQIFEIDPVDLDGYDIKIDSTIQYQIHKGFGGAFTNSSAYLYSLMNKENKDKFINLYFSKSGLDYNFGRLTIGSCDFSIDDYDYINKGDLDSFSLDYEKKYLFPLLNDVKKEKSIIFIASSWTPPKEFKTNKEKCKGGKLKKDCYQKYANYLVKYVKGMKDNGFNINYLTLQNEPRAKQTRESCLFNGREEAELAKDVHNELETFSLKDCNLLIHDHNLDIAFSRTKEILKNVDPSFISGVAVHWYNKFDVSNLQNIHERYPNLNIFHTEGCVEFSRLDDHQNKMGRFESMTMYLKNYILYSLNYVNAFIDWNLLLDQNGGPNHVNNFCEAPLIYDLNNKELIINPSYYAIKHFSYFIKENARRIDVISKDKDIFVTAYKNVDKSIIIIILNMSESRNLRLLIDKISYECYSANDSLVTIQIKGDL